MAHERTPGDGARRAGQNRTAAPGSQRVPERRRRTAQGKGPLQREEIVAAAIKASEEHGTAMLSMRGLADDLGVTAMALYGHVADKDELLDEILDHVLARDAPPAPFSADWRGWMFEYAEGLHRVLVAHAPLLDRYCRRPVGVPSALARMEAALAVLTHAGFGDQEAIDVFASVQTVTLGFTALEVARQANLSNAAAKRAATAADHRAAQCWPELLASLPADTFPHLRRLHPDLAAFTTAPQFRRVLDASLAGFSPRRSRKASRPR